MGRSVIAIGFTAVALVAAGCGGEASDDERTGAIEAAQQVYETAAQGGADLDAGPCIAEELPGYADWVADIAHDPREPVDDNPANQCARFRDGEASHFVELDPEGELIKAE